MTIEEFLSNANQFEFPSVPTGSAISVAEFYEGAILTPSRKDVVEGWHNLLTQYMDDPEAIILSRLYESEGHPGDWHTRRGMLTRMSDGFSYACASNYFARVIFTMAYYNFVPEYDDFKKMMIDRKFSLFYYITNHVEDLYAAFKTKAYDTRFYTSGWYLAHIMAVKDDYYWGYPNIDLKNIITLGTEDQWCYSGGFWVRNINGLMSEDEKKIAKAQFLRFLDPINYFLVPNNNNSSIYKIGENKKVVDYMRKMYFSSYGDTYMDFLNKALVDPNLISQKACVELGSEQIGVSFGLNVAGGDRNSPSVVFSSYEKACCLKAYLFDGFSYRRLERDILCIESENRGGGFKAQTMMRDFGLVSAHKGVFNGITLDCAILQSEGMVKAALEFIRDNL